ncbi:MAG: ATP-binding cassette domain-containing protein [Candidatus Tectimicrobiota bacterium]
MALFTLIRTLLKHLRPYAWQVGAVLLALLIDIAFFNLWPLSFKYLVEDAIQPQNQRVLLLILGVLAGGVLVASVAQLIRDYLYARIASNLLNDLRLHMFTHLQELSLGFYARTAAGDILARFSTDLAMVERAVTLSLPNCVYAAVGLLISAILLFHLEWRLALVTAIGLPLCFVGPHLLTPRAVQASRVLKDDEALLVTVVQENVRAQPIVQAFGLMDQAVRQFRSLLREVWQTGMRYRVLALMVVRTPNVSIFVLQLVVIGMGALMAFDGVISVGALFAVHGMFLNVSYSVTELTNGLPFLLDAGGGLQRIESLLAEVPASVEAPGALVLPRFADKLALEEVTFSYDGKQPNLRHVSLEIPCGATVAFVGPSGSGKSTVLSLLSRFYQPDSGRVTLDGYDINSATMASLRDQLGIVLQESFLFNRSVRDNLRIGCPEASDEELVRAARAAEIHELILTLPEGYDTVVGEGGSRLSGGQRQRLAIARALLRRPAILLLDEATSALDAGTEASITATLESLRQRHTIIQVTHRLAAITTADRIFVMEAGALVEQGSHTELLAQHGLYASLWNKQSGLVVSADGLHASVEGARLRSIPILETLSTAVLDEIAGYFATEHVNEGREIIHEGDSGDRFYIIVRGKAEALKAQPDNTQQLVGVLQDGDYFGEIALLQNVPRTATVRARTDCTLLSLGRGQFLRLMHREPHLRAQIAHLAAERSLPMQPPEGS